jgi:uncharacterized membrane protein
VIKPGTPRVPVRPARDPQAGAAGVTAMLFLLVMAGFLALSLSAGLLMDTRTQLQLGSDAAALAAAGRLNGTAQGLTNARTAAFRYSDEHFAYGQRLIIDPMSDVVFGRWHHTAGSCIATNGTCVGFEDFPSGFATANAGRVTAVRVRNGRDGGSHNPVVDLPFGAFMGTPTAAVRSAAVATGPGLGSVDCALPIGVAVCKVRSSRSSDDLLCTSPLSFSNDYNDSAGFIAFGGSPANGDRAADFINAGGCAAGDITLGQVNVQNGTDFSKVIDALRGVGQGNRPGTNICLIGTEQVLPIIDAHCDEDWANPKFNRDSDIVGFLRVTIRAVTDQQRTVLGCPGQPAPTLPADTGPPQRNSLVLDIACDQAAGPPGSLGGGEIFNATATAVRLVE